MKKYLLFGSLFLISLCVFTQTPDLSDSVSVLYYKDGVTECFDYSSKELVAKDKMISQDRAISLIDTIAQGPNQKLRSAGYEGIFPVGSEVFSIKETTTGYILNVAVPQDDLKDLVVEGYPERIIESFVYPLKQVVDDFSFSVRLRPLEDESAPFLPVSSYLEDDQVVSKKPDEAPVTRTAGQTPNNGQGQPIGPLTGKTVFLSPGHGWYHNGTSWVTQRGNSNGVIEDHSNMEACFDWLVKYLWNAGANVWPVRERDRNTNMVIVDNSDSGYSETGSWATQTRTTAYDGDHRIAAVASTETATATFTPTIPEDGYYYVYVWFTSHSSGSTYNTTDAKININHTGGTTQWVQNMQQDKSTWKCVGQYYFDAGYSASKGSVVISNQGANTADYVIADAVRFGGGMGDYVDGGSVSGHPRCEESGRYFAPFMGCDTAGTGTVWSLPKYAAWECESWEDAIYFSWHSNATGIENSTVRGTSTFVYSSEGWDGTFDGTSGSLQLRALVNSQLVGDLQTAYDSTWSNYGLHAGNYGEIRPSNNPDMPSVICETAFHDEATDANAIKDPEFRQIAARAVYKSIVKFFADKDGDWDGTIDAGETVNLLPEPPVNFSVKLNSSSQIVLDWDAPSYGGVLGDAATGYKVYLSNNGKGFANGLTTSATSYTLSSGLVAGQTYYLRVGATNSGGESFPTETLAVRYQPGKTNPILIVNGFDRLNRTMMIVESSVYREYLDRMNSYDYTLSYAEAVETYDEYFDSCSNEAIEQGYINLGDYDAVLWILGEESTVDDTFSATERSYVQTYLGNGGSIFVSGAEIGFELDYIGDSTTFYNSYLMADYAGDDADTYAVTGAAGGIFSSIGSFNFDDGTTIYDVDYPDQLTPLSGAVACLTYSGGNGGNAGIQYDGSYQVVNFGFPFEAITTENKREAIMASILDFFGFSGTGVVSDIILESRDAAGTLMSSPTYVEVAGDWADSSSKSSATGLTGSGARFSAVGPSSDTSVMTPNILTTGTYEVFATFGQSGNANNVRYIVKHATGSADVYLNQVPDSTSNLWHSLGSYSFHSGQNAAVGSVTVDESTVTGQPDTGFNYRVYVDGFKWEFVSSPVKCWYLY